MASDDELRRVAEDVRALARSLGRDLRAALDRVHDETRRPNEGGDEDEGDDAGPGRRSAREDLAAAGRAARDELRAAQIAVRDRAQRRLHRHDRRPSGHAPGPPGPPRWDNWGGPHRERGHGRRHPVGAPVAPSPAMGYAERAAATAPPPLRHRHDGTTLLGLLAVVFGFAWLAEGTHLASVSTQAVLAIALMVVGGATVVTARTDWALSRRFWPVLAGAAVAVGLIAYTASPGLPVGFRHLEVGSQHYAPATWTDVPATIHGGIGSTTVNLSVLPTPSPKLTTIEIDNAIGRIEIMLPDIPVVVDAHIAAGRIAIDGVVTAGVGRDTRQTLNALVGGSVLTLHIRAGFGAVDIVGPTTTEPPVPTTPARFQ